VQSGTTLKENNVAIQSEELAWGELRELPVASTFASFMWPNSTVFRMKPKASIDFVVVANNCVEGFIEVKVRRNTSVAFDTTVMHRDKHTAGRFNLKLHGVPTYAAILFADTFGWVNLALAPDGELELARYGQPVPHIEYKKERLEYSHLLFEEMQAKIAALRLGGQNN
jgi:hypothetical protein